MTHELTHVDLFSGIGGFTLAAEWAGFRTVAFSEVEAYACKVLAQRWPGVPNVGDVRIASNFARFRGATVLTGGFPCQPASLNGLRKGEKDDRWLWPAMREVIKVVRPTWVIGENVLGLVTLGLEAVLSDLAAIGYAAQPLVIPACAVGAWHIRKRVWILAHDEERNRHPSSVLEASGERRNEEQPGRRNRFAIHMLRRRSQARFKCEPRLGRLVHGIPNQAHRLEGSGNAIVPQVVAPFFRWIAQIERGRVTP